jgi:hypothetical protein
MELTYIASRELVMSLAYFKSFRKGVWGKPFCLKGFPPASPTNMPFTPLIDLDYK